VHIWLSASALYAQNDSSSIISFTQSYQQALRYSDISMFSESIVYLKQAIAIAEEHQWEEKRIDAVITLAETLRKTQDFDDGIEILRNLSNLSKYPRLHVRKLGRLAALHSERGGDSNKNLRDSVTHFIQRAIQITQTHNFPLEEASLKNELGYTLSGEGKLDEGLVYLLEAAEIFSKYGDEHNYLGALTNVLSNYIRKQENSKVDSISQIIESKLKGKSWYSAEVSFYNAMEAHANQNSDSVRALLWQVKSLNGHLNYNRAISNQQMSSLRVTYETERFKEEANHKAMALERETAKTGELFIYVSFLIFLVVVIFAFLFREGVLKRKLRRANENLSIANDKYQTLLVESNHRIRNNLQMVISMFGYSSKDANTTENLALKHMLGKIQTITLLHNHLSMDAQEDRVNLKTYYEEIISLFNKLNPSGFNFHTDFDSIQIESESIVYFGLILNEMLSNTMEHSDTDKKEIRISVRASNGLFSFQYQDNSKWDKQDQKGMGIQIIERLVLHINGSNYHCDPSRGLYKFEFSI
jgi:two-component sensor histidine kinase